MRPFLVCILVQAHRESWMRCATDAGIRSVTRAARFRFERSLPPDKLWR